MIGAAAGRGAAAGAAVAEAAGAAGGSSRGSRGSREQQHLQQRLLTAGSGSIRINCTNIASAHEECI